MKPRIGILTLAFAILCTCAPAPAYAQASPVEFSYQWTLSGKEYVTIGTPLRDLGHGLTFDGLIGYEVTSGATPSMGFGLGYTFTERRQERGEFYGKAGAFLLFPQSNKPDIGLGITAGWRF